MLDACLFVAMMMSDPPAAEPVAAEPAAEALPDPQWEEPGLRVARPGYDLGVDEVHVKKANGTQYKLSARQWNELVREDPDLWRLHVRGRVFVPGIVLGSIGGVWLAVSGALAADGLNSESATGRLFQWGFPAAMAVTGVTMTIIGVSARRQLHEARRRIYVSPYGNRQSAGVSFAGRF